MNSIKGQLTLRGVLIGCIGCIVITAASTYTALKMGALPWPIVFAAIISFFFLKTLGRGQVSLNEANVTHTIMSAGAMVAGGLAFTIPGAWMLGYAHEISLFEMFAVALSGVILGLICTAALRNHFIKKAKLEYPIGEAAVQTLIAGETGGKTGVQLFLSMGISGLYAALRDFLGIIPTMLLSSISIPGVAFGIYNSPLFLAVGFLVGTTAMIVWFGGAIFANFGIIVSGTQLGLWSLDSAQGIVSSLGMGVMVGSGIGVILKNILPALYKKLKQNGASASQLSTRRPSLNTDSAKNPKAPQKHDAWRNHITAGFAACGLASVTLLLCFGLDLGPIPTLMTVAFAWIATAMSAQSVGQTGIDPMEIFGLIVLLAVAAVSDIPHVQLFFVAGVVAVACGLAGDVMNDFYAGNTLGTSPKAQWIGQAFGGTLGAIVAVVVMALLLSAYGSESFGLNGTFVSAQASVVATMISGIPSPVSFAIGLAGGIILYYLSFPAMMLGLGIYLPFYMSLSAFLGVLAKFVFSFICKLKNNSASPKILAEKKKDQAHAGLVVSSGALGGESIIGVLVAIVAVLAGLST